MERHFAFPVLVAAAIHGGLFFGFPKGAAPVSLARPPSPAPTIEIVPPPPEPEPDIAPPDDSGPAGDPVALRPTIADTPTTPSPIDITIPVVTTPAVEVGPVDRIPPLPPGGPEGKGGIGPGVIFSPGSLDKAPQTRFRASPNYPYEAKRAGLSGTVTVEFTVDENGRVIHPRVVDSTSPLFEAAALQGVSKWRFEPGRRGGSVVRFRMAVPIQFSLSE